MDKNSVEKTREVLFKLIESNFNTDTKFERAAGLAPKTVNNWRRGLSASFMKMIPELAAMFGVPVSTLLCTDDRNLGDLSQSEQEIIALYRSAGDLSERELSALTETIKNTIDLYMASRRGDSEK